MRTRYSITIKVKYSPEVIAAFKEMGDDPDSHRELIFTNWANYFWDTPEGAATHLQAMKDNNNHEKLISMFGPIEELKVSAFECYDHGEAISCSVTPV